MRVRAECLLAAGLLTAATGSGAQTAPLRLEKQIGSSLVVSDNLGGSGESRDRGAMLTVSPGFRLVGRSASAQGSLNYTLNALQPVRVHERPDRLQHSLNANFSLAPIDTGFSLGVQAGIGRQSQSAFGLQRPGVDGVRTGQLNQAEVYSLSVAPALQGRLGELARWTLTHRAAVTNTRDSIRGDNIGRDSSLVLADASPGLLSWNLRFSDSRSDPKAAREISTQSAQFGLNWAPDVDWRFGAQLGRERSDLRSIERETRNTYGLSARWTPTPRTSLSLNADDRVFGRTHGLVLEHRFARASLRFSDSRSLSAPGVLGSIGSRTYYDLLFAQLAPVEPDPVARDLLVRSQLQARGLNPDGIATNGFISSRPALTRLQALSGTWQTARSTWTLSGSRSVNTRFGAALEGFDDFADSNVLVLKALSLSASYQLAPASSLSAVLQWQRNTGERVELGNSLRGVTLGWNASLGSQRRFSVQLRHSLFQSLLRPYEENALVMTLQQQF